EGRLLASTSTGQIVCFGPSEIANPPTVSSAVDGSPYPDDHPTSAARAMARQIIKDTGITSGYCLLLGAGDGRLSYELARRSDLRLYCLEPNPQRVAAAREALDLAGVYGVRVTVHQGSPQKLPYADYFANLIVLGDGTAEDLENCSARELYRVLRPCGGTAYIAAGGGAAAAKIERWLQGAGVPSADIFTSETAVQVRCGELPGAGEWTHQYADAGRSGASEDQIVKLPLRLLWFGKPGPAKMISRHWRGPAPLSTQGRLFAIGQHSITAVDAYNGRELWCRELPGAGRFPVDAKGSNAVADDDSVYAAIGAVCLRLDAATGETRQTYHPPPAPESLPAELAESLTWEYLAQNDDSVLGSMGSASQGRYIFGLNKDDGKPHWVYTTEDVVSNNAITVGEGRVYLIDRTTAAEIEKMKRRGERISIRSTLVALDAATGQTVW
ncbi:MAG: methyltransferase domain-containing protein, partial [Armatimonadetes bacterium]|nr:methyltransferase domain-containing protein [Armatimonadota bacterium]